MTLHFDGDHCVQMEVKVEFVGVIFLERGVKGCVGRVIK